MSRVRCFVLTATDHEQRWLRVYERRTGGCAGYCEARVPIAGGLADVDERPTPEQFGDDPRWPAACAVCRRPFTNAATRQVFPETVYVDPDGREVTLRAAPPGAMWRATWWEDLPRYRGPDGACWVVRLPDGRDWCMDGPADDGRKWIRTGTAPMFTVRPSIGSGEPRTYHGFLTAGVLESCPDSPT